MAIQTVFKRYEIKYMMTKAQKDIILEAMKPYMTLDEYGRSSIRNIYYDTDTFLLVRHSIDKPSYKEKLRVRSYGSAALNDKVFIELKKKYDKVVYKRRLVLPEKEAMSWISGEKPCPKDTQIAKEIDYFLKYYQTIHPVAFLSYEREAYYANDGSDFRVTFDDHILCRTEDLSLQSEVYGETVLPEDKVLMELKCSGGIPLWMVQVLSKEKIYKTSFSKYGTAYQRYIFPKQRPNVSEVTLNQEDKAISLEKKKENQSLEVAYHA